MTTHRESGSEGLMMADDLGKLLLRVTVGLLVLFHGVHKIVYPDALGFIRDQLASFGLPGLIAYGVYLGEIVGPVLAVTGLFARSGGFLIAGNMVVALILVHLGAVFTLKDTGGWALELQTLLLIGGVAILLLGSGRYAIRPD